MKKSVIIALCGIISAMAIVVMLMAYFPYLTYALPALAGCLSIVLVIECGAKYAFLSYVVVAALGFLICEKEAWLFYTVFFGYYPIIKMFIEKINKRLPEWIIKLLVFNIAFTVFYFLSTYVLGISMDDFGAFGDFAVAIFFICGNVMFIFYDIAFTGVISMYYKKYHAKIRKLIK